MATGPVRGRRISENEAFIAMNASKEKEETVDVSVGQEPDETVRIGVGYRKGPADVILFRKGAYGYEPRPVMASNIALCLQNGDLPVCGDCGSGDCDGHPNHCPGKDSVAVRRCPVCSKIIPDMDGAKQIREARVAAGLDEEDPNEIKDDLFAALDPAGRTRARLLNHLEWYHPEEARAIINRPLQRDSIDPSKMPQALTMEQAMDRMGELV